MSSDEERQKKAREAGEKEVTRLWRVWRTAHEMVQDRGYQLSEEEVGITLEGFRNMFSDGEGNVVYAPTIYLSMTSLITTDLLNTDDIS